MAVICGYLMSQVKINYNLSEYLPEDAPSTVSLKVMEQSFSEGIPNAQIYIENVTIPEALSFKEQIKAVAGVDGVLWLDDVIDVDLPLTMEDTETVEAWYKDGSALFSVTIADDNLLQTVEDLSQLIGDKGIISGEAVNQAGAQGNVMNEMPKIILFVIPLAMLILMPFYQFLVRAAAIPGCHRSCDFGKRGHQYFSGADFLCYAGNECDTAARCFDGLCGISSSQLCALPTKRAGAAGSDGQCDEGIFFGNRGQCSNNGLRFSGTRFDALQDRAGYGIRPRQGRTAQLHQRSGTAACACALDDPSYR